MTKITIASILMLSLPIEAKTIFTNDNTTGIYNLKLDKNNTFEAQMHDYINDVLYECEKEPLDKEYWYSSDSPKINERTLPYICPSLLTKPIDVRCYQEGEMLTSESSVRYIEGIGKIYPITTKKDALSGVRFYGKIVCYLNKDFEYQNQQWKPLIYYTLDNTNINLSIMYKPLSYHNDKLEIIDAAILIPDNKELPIRRETILLND